MKLFVNGCSHTAGTREALDADFSNTWPGVLKKLGLEVTDKSLKGCSNERILRSSVAHILEDNYDFVAIQWTFSERFETPSPEHAGFYQHLPWAINGYGPDHPHAKFYEEFYPRQASHVRENRDQQLIHQMYLMQTVLQAKNINYCFMVWFPIYKACLRHNTWKYIDKDHILNYKDGQIIGMDNILHDAGYKLSKRPIIGHEEWLDHHYMADGHLHIAKMVMEYISTV